MKRKTNIPAREFEYAGQKYKTEALGFLASSELLLKYSKIFLSLKDDIKEVIKEKEGKEIKELEFDLSSIVNKLPDGVLGKILIDLLPATYYLEGNKWIKVDPDDFENLQEAIEVAKEAFLHNFSDLLTVGEDSEDTSEPETDQTIEPQNKIIQL